MLLTRIEPLHLTFCSHLLAAVLEVVKKTIFPIPILELGGGVYTLDNLAKKKSRLGEG